MTAQDAEQVFQQNFLELRHRLLDIAATLDRVDHAGGSLGDENQTLRDKVDQAIEVLRSDQSDRTAAIQQIFSRTYQSDWQSAMGVG